MPFDPSINAFIEKSRQYPGWIFEEEDASRYRGRWKELIGRDRLTVEIGPGNGWFFFEYLQRNPDEGGIAIEKKFKRAVKTAEKLRRAKYRQSRVIRGRGECLSAYFGTGEVDRYIIHFPTPWVKPHHKKRILFSESFVDALSKTLSPKGEIFLKSDHNELMAIAAEQLVRRSFLLEINEPKFELSLGWGKNKIPMTGYEKKLSELGKSFFSL